MTSKATPAPTYMLHEGDCLEWLRSLPSDSVDSCVTDPPYGLSAEPNPAAVLSAWLRGEEFHHKSKGFMSKTWDSMVPGPTVWKEIHRVLKPGGMLLAFAGTRTWDLMSMAIRLAGFENRDTVRHDFGVSATSWSHGQGFPKGKSQFKPAWEPILVFRKPGPLREYRIDECRVCRVEGVPRATGTVNPHAESGVNGILGSDKRTDRQQRYDSNLPSGRWPANAVFSHTTSCVKVGEKDVHGKPPERLPRKAGTELGQGSGWNPHQNKDTPPRHNYASKDGKETVADWRCAGGCVVAQLDAQSGVSKSGKTTKPLGTGGIWSGTSNTPCGPQYDDKGGSSRFYHQFSPDADLADPIVDLPVVDLPTFIYQAKASRSERERGCEGLESKERGDSSGNNRTRVCSECGLTDNGSNDHSECGSESIENSVAKPRRNTHVSVKPLALMRHLCRLVTPVGGVVIDPFAGSGTTGCAAMMEGLGFLGAEREAEYVAIARARIGYYFAQSGGVASDGVAVRQKSSAPPALRLRSLADLPKRG